MGGFEGGDEAGFWEVEESNSIYKSKTSSKTKYQITKDNLTYTIEAIDIDGVIKLLPSNSNRLTIKGHQTDIIQKAYKTLIEFTDDMEIIDFFHTHKIVIEVSDDDPILGALFILLTKDACNLILTNDELKEISQNIGADITQLL
jgi:hypothetical protein